MKLEDINIYNIGNSVYLVGAVYHDGENNIICLTPENHECKDSPVKTLIMNNEEWLKFMLQSDVVETEINTEDADGKIKKAIYRKCQRGINQNISWEVYKRDGYKCRYCDKEGPLTVDHIDLWENGGATVVANLVSACKRCNKKRGNMEYDEWINSSKYFFVSQTLPASVRELNAKLIDELSRLRELRVKNIISR